MPYVISKKDKEYCVFKEGADGKQMGSTHGCHPTHEKALAQMRALYAAEGKSFLIFEEGEEWKAKKKDGTESRPSSEFLVVEDKDKPGTWHLPVYQNGKLSPRLLGAAHAALTVGYRGNVYSGPNKEEALKKLKRLYKQAGLQWPGSKDTTKKTISLFDLEQKVRDAVKEKMMEAMGETDMMDMPYCPIDVFVDFAIIKAPGGLYQIPYSIDAVTYEITLGEPIKVKIEYLPDDAPQDTTGESPDEQVYNDMMSKDIDLSIKALGEDRVGGYAVLWGSELKRDLTGEWFSRTDTQELTTIYDTLKCLPFLFHHGLDESIKTSVIGIVNKLEADSIGLWYEAQLQKSTEYDEYIKKLIAAGKLKTSSQTFAAARQVNKSTGMIERWPVIEITATPTPAEYRMSPISFLKTAFKQVGCTDFDCVINQYGIVDGDAEAQGAVKARAEAELELDRLALLDF